MCARDECLAPAAITVKSATTKQQDKHNDNQQQVHDFLQHIVEPLLAGGSGLTMMRASEAT